jgi:hypothetical protein
VGNCIDGDLHLTVGTDPEANVILARGYGARI